MNSIKKLAILQIVKSTIYGIILIGGSIIASTIPLIGVVVMGLLWMVCVYVTALFLTGRLGDHLLSICMPIEEGLSTHRYTHAPQDTTKLSLESCEIPKYSVGMIKQLYNEYSGSSLTSTQVGIYAIILTIQQIAMLTIMYMVAIDLLIPTIPSFLIFLVVAIIFGIMMESWNHVSNKSWREVKHMENTQRDRILPYIENNGMVSFKESRLSFTNKNM